MGSFLANAAPFAAFVAFGLAWAAGNHRFGGGPHHG